MTTTYTFDQLKEDVRKEAEALRIHATKEERGCLDFDNLDPEVYDECIYGQMTGDCNSIRGIQLIENCAVRYIKDGDLIEIVQDGFERIKKYVNGEKVENLFKKRNGYGSWEDIHYSAIEAYILLPEARNANLIAFLRGETETLEL
jgi:hypothetical protein